MATGQPQEAVTTAGIRDDGSPLCVRVKAFPVFDDQEKVTGFIEVVEDVSHKVEAERELAEEKERLAVTLRSIGDGVIATDTAGRIVLINKVAEELCGWSLAEAAGRPCTRFSGSSTRRPVGPARARWTRRWPPA